MSSRGRPVPLLGRRRRGAGQEEDEGPASGASNVLSSHAQAATLQDRLATLLALQQDALRLQMQLTSELQQRLSPARTLATPAPPPRPGAWGGGGVGDRADGGCVLTRIEPTPRNLVLLVRWSEFLLGRLPRERIPPLLEFYQRVGWISAQVRQEVLQYLGGGRQDELLAAGADTELLVQLPQGMAAASMPQEWRLGAPDHLTSLWFVINLSGQTPDRDGWLELEGEIARVIEEGCP